MTRHSSPKYTQTYTLNSLPGTHFLVLAQKAAQKLGWEKTYINQSSFFAHVLSEDTIEYEVQITLEEDKAYLQSESVTNSNTIADRNKENILILIQTIEELQSAIQPEDLTQQASELPSTLPMETSEAYHETALPTDRGWLWAFVPVEGYFVTPILIILNIVIFIAMALAGVGIIEPDTDSLIQWGANFKPYTLDNQWWRLLTCVFIHIGIFHLLMNMYALMFIGALLEPFLGKLRFLTAYLLTGLTASLASLWWHDLTVSAGASGAIFGMYGVFLAMLTTNLIEKESRQSLLGSISVFVIYNLVGGLRGGIDNAAHIGGLVGGIVIGYALSPSLLKPTQKQLNTFSLGGITLLIILFSFVVYTYIPNPIGEYDTRMQNFYDRQAVALRVYEMPESTPRDQLLISVRDTGLVYWKQNLQLVKEVDKLNLPESFHAKNQKLIQYCDLRIKSYELMYKALLENTDAYESQLDTYYKKLATVLEDINGKPAK
ncbi:rhomboid family intramembrane serine protease [Xanthocytophaga flava]|uniref:rhomboid family intramembrane serine protease n=1 Tax=Xanthocytophaga flava TaxID=3048013 RepID=UPI0028D5C51A|nr:rhomboid family intramembrane serine protease [Xanthocytophaga flavus]MDJ1469963.1 rhomboid family intramembrane serine protease [Xanthocytophaga flavus]